MFKSQCQRPTQLVPESGEILEEEKVSFDRVRDNNGSVRTVCDDPQPLASSEAQPCPLVREGCIEEVSILRDYAEFNCETRGVARDP